MLILPQVKAAGTAGEGHWVDLPASTTPSRSGSSSQQQVTTKSRFCECKAMQWGADLTGLQVPPRSRHMFWHPLTVCGCVAGRGGVGAGGRHAPKGHGRCHQVSACSLTSPCSLTSLCLLTTAQLYAH